MLLILANRNSWRLCGDCASEKGDSLLVKMGITTFYTIQALSI